MIKECEKTVLDVLEERGIEFIRLEHEAASTMELCRSIGAEYGARHCKNLFLTNRSENVFRLLLMEPDKAFRTSEISKKLGLSRMSFGSNELLMRVLGLEQGSVSVMGLVNESAVQACREGKLQVVIDKALLNWERICVHPNTNTASLVIRTTDIIKLLEEWGIPFTFIDIDQNML